MKLFDDTIGNIRAFLAEKRAAGDLKEFRAAETSWPAGEKGNIVLASDTGVELGNPGNESSSFILWTEKSDEVRDGLVSLVGPDLASSTGQSLPFGKVVILAVEGMDENNCYERHREIDIARYNLNLKGYMMRAVSQYLREWSRVSREAVENGFDFSVIAAALLDIYKGIDFVKKAEFVFVTSSREDVSLLREEGSRVERLIGAMNKMAFEMSFDCGTCDYTDVCTEVEDLRNMRQNLIEEKEKNAEH